MRYSCSSCVLLCFLVSQANAVCTFRTMDLSKNVPLILKLTGTEDDRFILPKRQTDILLFQRDEQLLLACPGNTNFFTINRSRQNFREATVTCVQNKIFRIGNIETNFTNIECGKVPVSSLRVTGDCGNSNRYKKVHVGFHLPVRNESVKLIELCYDTVKHVSLYAGFKITKGIMHGQNKSRSTYFRTEMFRDNLKTTFNDIYKGQISRFRDLLGIELNETTSALQKGHLAAHAHFPYHSQQEATMYAINTVPQFRTVNTGNWKKLEGKLRSYANGQDQDLHVYVGTYGVLKLAAASGKLTEIHLWRNGTVNILPVPEIVYAIVYNQSMSHGAAIVAVNNDVTSHHEMLCSDQCSQMAWISRNWQDRTDATKGYLYCCTLNAFLRRTGLRFPDKPLLI